MTPQKVIDSYESYTELKKFVERYENMTEEERAAVPKTEIELDWTEDEDKQFRAAAETAGLTLDEFVEKALHGYFKQLLDEHESFDNMSKAGLESLRNDDSIIDNAVEMNKKEKD